MPSNFAQQWSLVLGFNIAETPATTEGISKIGQAIFDFKHDQNFSKNLEALNKELKSWSLSSDLDVYLKKDSLSNVNDTSVMVVDSFMIDVVKAVQGTWPDSWNNELKEPLIVFAGYVAATNAVGEGKIDWKAALPILVGTYINKHGIESLTEQIDGLDQLLPQVLTGIATTVLSLKGIEEMNIKMQELSKNVQPGIKPKPSDFLDIVMQCQKKESNTLESH